MPQDAPPDGGARDSVRRAARGNGPVATPEPRPGPTQQAESWHASSVPSASEGLPHSIAAHRGAIAADEDTVLARPARPMLHEDGQDMGRNDNGALTCVRLRISVESNWRFQQLNPITAHCHRRRREVNIRGTQRQGLTPAKSTPRGQQHSGPVPGRDGFDQRDDLSRRGSWTLLSPVGPSSAKGMDSG